MSRRIQDLEGWLAWNALRGGGEEDEGDDGNGEHATADRREAAERLREHEEYQRELHERFFGSHGAENDAAAHADHERERIETMKRFESMSFTFLVRANDDVDVNAKALITSEGASTQSVPDSTVKADGDDGWIEVMEKKTTKAMKLAAKLTTDSQQQPTTTATTSPMPTQDETLDPHGRSSSSFPAVRIVAVEVPLRAAAQAFETVYVAASRHNCERLSLVEDGYAEGSVWHVSKILTGEATVEGTPDELAVDCCRLCHYLQGAELVDRYAEMLVESVDTYNCLGMLELSEQLRLPRLWERSLQQLLHAMDRLGSHDDGEPLSSPVDQFTPELQSRVAAIQSAIRSSVHGWVGSSRSRPPGSASSCGTSTIAASTGSRLFFSSVEEYIAIFAERVQYYRERLAAAKEQADELLMLLDPPRRRAGPMVGRFVSTAPSDRLGGRLPPSDRYLDDLRAKIKRQEARVRTLEIALQEHKNLLLGASL